MSRQQFMNQLYYYLRLTNLSETEIEKIIRNYEARFDAGEKAGISIDKVIEDLGDPEQIAKNSINNKSSEPFLSNNILEELFKTENFNFDNLILIFLVLVTSSLTTGFASSAVRSFFRNLPNLFFNSGFSLGINIIGVIISFVLSIVAFNFCWWGTKKLINNIDLLHQYFTPKRLATLELVLIAMLFGSALISGLSSGYNYNNYNMFGNLLN